MQSLKLFYDNVTEREAVREFLIESLREIAIEKTFDGEDVTGIKEARQTIDKMFDKLDELYGIKSAIIMSNSR